MRSTRFAGALAVLGGPTARASKHDLSSIGIMVRFFAAPTWK